MHFSRGMPALALCALLASGCSKSSGDAAAPPSSSASSTATATATVPSEVPAARVDAAVAAPATPIDMNDAASFWTGFRDAISAGDDQGLSAFVLLPFKTRGMDDDDPVIKHDAAAFAKLWPLLLSADPGLNREPTMKDMIAALATIPEAELAEAAHGAFRIGDFEFERGSEGWRLTMAYFDATANQD